MSKTYPKEIIMVVYSDLATRRIIAFVISMREEHISVLFTIVSSVPYMVPNKHTADSQLLFNLCINK